MNLEKKGEAEGVFFTLCRMTAKLSVISCLWHIQNMRYEIKGGELPVVEIHLESEESINCENGAMSWMTDNVAMQTKGGGIGKMVSKAFSGEAMFGNTYTAQKGPGMITMCTNFPGSIVAIEITPGKEIICQKGAYLASTPGVEMSIFFQKKVGSGFFGGEGFIMQKMSGTGLVFIEIDGAAIEYSLDAGQRMIIDTGYLAMMDATCSMDVETVKGGVKNMFLGGEGLFNTVVTGPGKIILQTLPKIQMASAISAFMATGR